MKMDKNIKILTLSVISVFILFLGVFIGSFTSIQLGEVEYLSGSDSIIISATDLRDVGVDFVMYDIIADRRIVSNELHYYNLEEFSRSAKTNISNIDDLKEHLVKLNFTEVVIDVFLYDGDIDDFYIEFEKDLTCFDSKIYQKELCTKVIVRYDENIDEVFLEKQKYVKVSEIDE